MSLVPYMVYAKGEEDGGWNKLTKLIRQGRRVAQGERLRWQENREFYRGNQTVYVAPSEAHLKTVSIGTASSQIEYNIYNRMRQFMDGRTALLTKEKPPFAVNAEDADNDSRDAAKQAQKFLDARWGASGWNIRQNIARLVSGGDIHGIVWLNVMWDPEAANSRDILIGIRRDTGQPIQSRSEFEALKAEDPAGKVKWEIVRSPKALGDVSWRVVLPGAISVDPYAISRPEDANWICESRMVPREIVETKLGMKYSEAIRQYRRESGSMGEQDYDYEDVAIEDGGRMNEADSVWVNYFFARPCTAFPKGLHLEYADKIPNKPWVMEEWEQDIPYKAFVPRPDPGHFIKSKGMGDDLKPMQRDLNRLIRDTREWLKRIAHTPIAVPFGGLMSDSFYNDEGVVFYQPALGPPTYPQFPSEPAAVFSNEFARITEEMRQVSGISASAQGLRAPGAPDAAVGLNIEIQQTEQNLAEMEAQLKAVIEWGCQTSLRLVEKHYTITRFVSGVGVDNDTELGAFQGAMMRGAGRFQITGPLMPKSKAARMQSIKELVPLIGERVVPFIGHLIDGDPDSLAEDLERDERRQREETRRMLGFTSSEMGQKVWENFQIEKQRFTEALNIMIQNGEQDPFGALQRQAEPVMPPNLTRSMQEAGFDIPMVEDFHNHALELKALDDFRKSDAYPKISEFGKQLMREHAQAHRDELAKQQMAMASQIAGGPQGSAPKELGTPSPPKQPGMPLGG